MLDKVFWALVGVNVVLGAVFLVKMNDNQAVAQLRRPSDYLLVPGEVTGGNNGIIYIIDTSNGAMGAMSYDASNKNLATMAPIDLNRIYEEAAGAAGGGGNGGGRSGGRNR